ncbi:MAG TPA: hypothetical protein VLC09_15920 [Polyangiaceae bacterium]|nr:hypothetical protein [Polyangiaceae bacterium]
MRTPKILVPSLVAGLLSLVGCTVVVDQGPLSEGCPADEKVCESNEGYLACYERTNPAYGCGGDDCSACAIPHAVPRCSKSGECIISTCDGTYFDCDDDVDNGCETDRARDERNCGSCGYVCKLDNAAAVCSVGICTISVCKSGFSDCDGEASNGCECSGGCVGKACE